MAINKTEIFVYDGWILSPAFDIIPSVDKDDLALYIDTHNNELDFELAKTVGEYLLLSNGYFILCHPLRVLLLYVYVGFYINAIPSGFQFMRYFIYVSHKVNTHLSLWCLSKYY